MWPKNTVLLSVLSLLSPTLIREGMAQPESRKILYVLEDTKHEQWCAFGKESDFKTEVNSLRATTVATIEYLNGRISAINVATEDDPGAGDWIVYDRYSVSETGALRTLDRTMNVLPGDRQVKEVFVIHDGKAKRQRTTNLSLRTKKPVAPVKVWLPDVPIITNVRAFPFWPLIEGKRPAEIWSGGKVCVDLRGPSRRRR